MKLAVLLVGEYRTFPYCRKTMLFLDQHVGGQQADIYFSTWKMTAVQNQIMSRDVAKSDSAHKMPVRSAEILRILGRDAVVGIQVPTVRSARYSNTYTMINGWIRGINLVKQSGIEYDHILVLRPDLFFMGPAQFDASLFGEYDRRFGVRFPGDDACFFSTYSNMKKILKDRILAEFFREKREQFVVHDEWQKYILDLGLEFKPLPLVNQAYKINRFPGSDQDTWEDVLAKHDAHWAQLK